ncbi:MAG TPA: Gfo/Idh/MocA family oxidoreductase [Polyangia bacterium]|jgi:predicted dehydrogenase
MTARRTTRRVTAPKGTRAGGGANGRANGHGAANGHGNGRTNGHGAADNHRARRRTPVTAAAPLRGALIGFGTIAATGHVPAYLRMPDVRIEAVCDITPARREAAQRLIPGMRTYGSYPELLAAEKLDFVDIATPPNVHAEIAHAALAQGLHVLCEKPLTLDSRSALRLLEAARRHGRVVMPCHNYVHAPVIRAMREIIGAGTIGTVRSVTLSTFRPTHARGVPEWNPHWRRDPKLGGGGILMDHGPHSCYVMFLLMGGYPTAVSARGFTLDPEYLTEDNSEMTLRFPHGIAQLHLSWTAALRRVVYTVHGTTGALVVADDALEIVTPAGVERRSIRSRFEDASHSTWFAPLFAEFRQAIDTRTPVPVQAREAAFTMGILESAYRSASQNGREQPLDPTAIGGRPRRARPAVIAETPN